MGSLSCYEVCFACGSHSASESAERRDLFFVLWQIRPWDTRRPPLSPSKTLSFRSSTLGGLRPAHPLGESVAFVAPCPLRVNLFFQAVTKAPNCNNYNILGVYCRDFGPFYSLNLRLSITCVLPRSGPLSPTTTARTSFHPTTSRASTARTNLRLHPCAISGNI